MSNDVCIPAFEFCPNHARILSSWHKEGVEIVFTNGCFDIIHRGHTDLINTIRRLLIDDCKTKRKLVIGLNGDKSVRNIKGLSRPINNEDDREKVLMSIKGVDLVIPFYEETPLNLINSLEPHIIVKGGDYLINTIVGAAEVAEWGGTAVCFSHSTGYSTTELINRIVEIENGKGDQCDGADNWYPAAH